MRTLTILTLFLGLMMTSCRKESLTYIDEIETEDPQQIAGAFFKGQISSPTGATAGAKVEVFQNEKLIGTVISDATGAFNTLGIKIDTASHVTFAVKHDDFNTRAKRVAGSSKKQDVGKIMLSKDQLISTEQTYLSNPGSNDLIVVSGFVKNTAGQPALADVLIIYDITEVAPFSYEAEGDGVSTDENGYYEFLLPKDKEFYYYVQQSLCKPEVLSGDETRIFGGVFPVELIGPFVTNTELPVLSNAKVEVNGVDEQNVSFFVSGLQCDGNIVTNGSLQGTISKGNQVFPIKLAALNFGPFWFGQDFCVKQENLSDPWKVSFTIIDYANVKVSEIFNFDVIEDLQDLQDLGFVPVCQESFTDKAFVQWKIGKNPYYYEINQGSVDNGTLVSSSITSQSNGNLRFTIPGYTSGNTKMTNFTFNGGLVGELFGFIQKPSDDIIITYLPSSDPKIVIGRFEGNLTNTITNVPFPIRGTFLVKLP